MVNIYVIIPVYNAEKYLQNTICSVLNQASGNFRIILIDDGSNDNSPELCDQFEKNYFQVHTIHQENGGVSRARNIGIDYVLQTTKSEDTYLAFLDADDLWHTDFLTNELAEHIAKTKHDIYGFETVNCNEAVSRFSSPSTYSPQIVNGGTSAIWCLNSHFGANLYHISLFRKWGVRFYEQYKYSEDKYFKLQCSYLARSIELVHQIMYIYRQNSTGAMGKSRSIPAIDYYLPIIEGWLKTDNDINNLKDTTGIKIDAGHVLANVYFLDMASTHYMQMGASAKIRNVIRNHPHYPYFIEMHAMGDNDRNYRNKVLYFSHPLLYALKYRVAGIFLGVFKRILRIPPIALYLEKRKYPHAECP